ncbi:MAG: hypothetical protein V5B31_04935 [Candidatus Accumulibacter propinquus]|jgi:hypothetical protein|uniref:hypothetical protein n=1 Tax=Candidatus Accumulibacter propinquus TaxID=2954380 RepID=UPI002FC2DD36
MNQDNTDSSDERRRWMDETFDANKKERSERLLSSHALLLEIDIGHAFCAGAWISTIVLACPNHSLNRTHCGMRLKARHFILGL